jgi:hypothetical protein
MRLWRRLLRIIGYTCLAVLSLLLVAFIAVQIQQHIFRHRAERLLADFHSIHLRETTWPEAKVLMQRWSKYGHADGPCDATSCGYAITLSDPNIHLYDRLGERWNSYLIKLHYYDFDAALGGRSPRFLVSWVVQDGRIVRSSVGMSIQTPSWAKGANGYEYSIIADAKSRSRLDHDSQDFQNDGWVLGDDEQLDDHPDYKVGRPGGCTFCKEGLVTFTPFLDQADVTRLTNFNLDCITSFHPCTDVSDLLPPLAPFHLYRDEMVAGAVEPVTPPCRTVPRAVGRDADVVVEAVALTSHTETGPELLDLPAHNYEVAKVQILRTLKGESITKLEGSLMVLPFSGYSIEGTAPSAQHLIPNHRYLLSFRKDYLLHSGGRPIGLNRCGIFDDTPDNLAGFQAGFAQDEKLRRSQGVRISH